MHRNLLKTLQQFSDSLQPSDLNFEPTGYECRDAVQVVREHEDFHSFNTKLAQKYQTLCLKRGLFAAAPRHRPGLTRWTYVVAVDVAQRLPTQVAFDVVQYFVRRESHRCDNRGAGVVADLHPVTDGEPRFEYCHVEPLTRRQAGADAKTSGGSESPCR